MTSISFGKLCRSLLLFLPLVLPCLAIGGPPFSGFRDPNPSPGNQFGHSVVALTTGNVVITAPCDDAGGKNAGAVYLFNGATGALISTLTGSTPGDRVGNSGVTALSNGNFVILSTYWCNGATRMAGAATFGNGKTGISGQVSSTNSLVGTSSMDQVGFGGVVALSQGNYVVISPRWNNGEATNAGAVTWGSGSRGISGTVSSANSLVGAGASNQVGSGGVTLLSNGNYVVRSPGWDNGPYLNAGAVTWGNGNTGTSGEVSVTNSLVGARFYARVGENGVTALTNGNYVVRSTTWDNGDANCAGAVTWGNGSTGISGVQSGANSLVGTSSYDRVGSGGVTPLPNGNYVVCSPKWNHGKASDAGAATWCNGSTGARGALSSANSLVGIAANERIGSGGATALSNGHYVVLSPSWGNTIWINDGLTSQAGAVTWGNGRIGTSGTVSSANSLIGSTDNDQVGSGGVTVLKNGCYLVHSPNWNHGKIRNAGAVTWGNGSTGASGTVSSANSLVGGSANDHVGSGGVTELSDGCYVVISLRWNNGKVTDAGAATWGSGSIGTSGIVSSANSLVGSSANDQVGSGGVMSVGNGSYVVSSPLWNNGRIKNAGAVTFGYGLSKGIRGVIRLDPELPAAASLMGTMDNDQVGSGGVTALTNGNYVVVSPQWSNRKGAVAMGFAKGFTSHPNGELNRTNSLVGSTAGDRVGSGGATALSNGNYVVNSPDWNNRIGAVTQGDGKSIIKGEVSSANSVVGRVTGDQFSSGGVNAPFAAEQLFYVILKEVRKERRLSVIKQIRDFFGVSLKEAVDIVEAPPCTLALVSQDQAEELKRRLEETGATIEITKRCPPPSSADTTSHQRCP